MDLFHVIKFFRPAVLLNVDIIWLASIICIFQIPGSNLDQRLAFFHILYNFYTVSSHHSMLHDFGKLKSWLNKSMVPEKATNFYNVSITFTVSTFTDTNDNLSVSIVSTLCHQATPVLPLVGAQRHEEPGAPPAVSDPR
jgi:hypothetical protein